MTLKALLAFMSLWLFASAVTLIVFRYVIGYVYEDLPPKPWLRRLVLLWYFPLTFSLFGLFALSSYCERDEKLPVMRPFLAFYWKSLKDPLTDYGMDIG